MSLPARTKASGASWSTGLFMVGGCWWSRRGHVEKVCHGDHHLGALSVRGKGVCNMETRTKTMSRESSHQPVSLCSANLS